jgi:hypothetical protein
LISFFPQSYSLPKPIKQQGRLNVVGLRLSARLKQIMGSVWNGGCRCHGFVYISFKGKATLVSRWASESLLTRGRITSFRLKSPPDFVSSHPAIRNR